MIVFKIHGTFHFRQNSRWWSKFGEVVIIQTSYRNSVLSIKQVQNLPKITLYIMVGEINSIFHLVSFS